MKIRLYPVALPLLLALGACQPGPTEYTAAESPKVIRVDSAGSQLSVAFAPGSAALNPREGARLQHLVLAGAVGPEDKVTILASGDPRLREERVLAIRRELLRYGIVATAGPLGEVPRDRAIVGIGRYMVTTPPCPNWSKNPSGDWTNSVESNFGCATATNLAVMVASPGDLVRGRDLGPANGKLAGAAVQRYLNDNVKQPQQFDGAAASPGTTLGGTVATGGGH